MSESRCFRIAGPVVAEALEVLARLGTDRAAPRPRPSRDLQSIRRRRLCYERLAGELGIAMLTGISGGLLRRRHRGPS